MKQKVGALLSSVRFWVITITAAIYVIEQSLEGGFELSTLLRSVEVWLGTVVGIGTLDSISEKFGSRSGKGGTKK